MRPTPAAINEAVASLQATVSEIARSLCVLHSDAGLASVASKLRRAEDNIRALRYAVRVLRQRRTNQP